MISTVAASAVIFFNLTQADVGVAQKRRDMNRSPAVKVLTLKVEGRRLMAAVSVKNVSDRDIKILYEFPYLEVFRGKKIIRYLGPQISRQEYQRDDYEILRPGAATSRHMDITERYEWLPGVHTYRVAILGGHQDPVSHEEWNGPMIVKSIRYSP